VGKEGEVELWMVGCLVVLPWLASRSLPAPANGRPRPELWTTQKLLLTCAPPLGQCNRASSTFFWLPVS
jgi:hypothetical protein